MYCLDTWYNCQTSEAILAARKRVNSLTCFASSALRSNYLEQISTDNYQWPIVSATDWQETVSVSDRCGVTPVGREQRLSAIAIYSTWLLSWTLAASVASTPPVDQGQHWGRNIKLICVLIVISIRDRGLRNGTSSLTVWKHIFPYFF